MKVWSRKPIYYYVLKIVKILLFVQIKIFKLDDNVMNCVFNDYPIYDKGYQLWKVELRGSKFIIEDVLLFVNSVRGGRIKTWR